MHAVSLSLLLALILISSPASAAQQPRAPVGGFHARDSQKTVGSLTPMARKRRLSSISTAAKTAVSGMLPLTRMTSVGVRSIRAPTIWRNSPRSPRRTPNRGLFRPRSAATLTPLVS